MTVTMKTLLIFAMTFMLAACDNKQSAEPSPELSIKDFIQQHQELEIVSAFEVEGFKEAFELRMTQPLDHRDAKAGSFEQRVHLLHRDRDAPTYIWMSGYDTHWPIRSNVKELANILNSNLVIVEYRFYGTSLPESGKVPWLYLDNTQGATDHHKVIALFKRYYSKQWLSAGFSKGGESALIHRSLFPTDVDVVVTYDAPIIHGRENTKTDAFLYSHGSKACRTRLFDYQRIALENRQAMLERIEQYGKDNGLTFERLGFGGALEYAVLEHTFTFWQRGHQCEDVPVRGDSVDNIFKHLVDTSGLEFYSDKGIHDTRQSYYQHMRELGYYGFPTERLSDVLIDAKDANNEHLAPKGVDLTYNPQFMQNVHNWLNKNGNNIIYLYGENDTWAASGVVPTANTNALRFDKKDGYHWSHIKDFSDEQKQRIYNTLEQWLGIAVNRI